MAYDKKILSTAKRELEWDALARKLEFENRRAEVYEKIPEIRKIDRKLASTAFSVLRESMETGKDPQHAILALKEDNLALQKKRGSLLRQFGYDENHLIETPLCQRCSDSGYHENKLCICVKERYARLLTKQLSTILPIEKENFSTFRLDFYSTTPDSRLQISPLENMSWILDTCKEYAANFSLRKSENLLMHGSTGLGKTFLSSCIAAAVSEKGHSVAYDTAINIVAAYETLKFGTGDGTAAADRTASYERADLLIIDDMGTEMGTAFTVSALYNLINTRLMSRRPMIINTNLMPEQFSQKYSPAVASRLIGDFVPLRFMGEDIRQRRRFSGF